MNLSSIPILDHPSHSISRPGAPLEGVRFRRFFPETTDPEMAAHIRHTVFYMRMLRDVADLLGCEPTEAAVWAARAAAQPEAYIRQLFAAGNFRALQIDTGYASPTSYATGELSALIGRPIATIIRLETLMEDLIAASATFQQVELGIRDAVRAARAQGIIGLKSIAAYRGGLHVAPRT